jgi:putative transposase
MARPLRMLFPGAFYHVMSRGNAKGLIFIDDSDREKFLEILAATVTRFRLVCYAFCLMPNHYHLVLMTPEPNLSAAIKHLNGVYSQWWNQRHQRCGHVFQGRFKAQLIQRERYLVVACRYVVLNPVRGGLASHPGEWRWSSYRASAHLDPPPTFFDASLIDVLLTGHSGIESGLVYQRFVNDSLGDDLDLGRLIRKDARFLGDEGFLKEKRAAAALESSRAIPRRETRPQAISLSRLFNSVRSRHEREAQIQRACVELGYRATEVARHLGLHPVTVGDILRAQRKRSNCPVGNSLEYQR